MAGWIDQYQQCVAEANSATFAKYAIHGPYEPDSEEHTYWLQQFDAAMKKAIF